MHKTFCDLTSSSFSGFISTSPPCPCCPGTSCHHGFANSALPSLHPHYAPSRLILQDSAQMSPSFQTPPLLILSSAPLPHPQSRCPPWLWVLALGSGSPALCPVVAICISDFPDGEAKALCLFSFGSSVSSTVPDASVFIGVECMSELSDWLPRTVI